MWKAEKIELKKNSDDAFYRERALYLGDCYTLEINDVLISNAIQGYARTLPIAHEWETLVCTECGVEGCNAAGILRMRRDGDKLLIIPVFEQMDGFEQYNYDTCEGNRYCAPPDWYDNGILIIEGDMLNKFQEILTGFPFESVPPPTTEEIDLMAKWEECVATKPDGFLRKEKIENVETK